MKNGSFVLFFVQILFATVAHAGPWDLDPLPSPSPRPSPSPSSIIKDLVHQDVQVTQKIDSMASTVDVWLAGDHIVDKPNATKVIFRNQFNWPSGGPFGYTPLLNVRLHLPNLERKWQLKFATYDEDVDRGINRDRLRTTPIGNEYAGSVGLFQKLGNVNVQFEPRVEFNGGVQISYFASLSTPVKTTYFTVHPEAQFFAKSLTGVGEYLSSNIDIPIYKTLTLTLVDEEQYLDQVNIFSTNLGIGFTYLYNEKMSHGYALIYEASSRPIYELNRYSVATTFTHKVLKNVFQYVIQPYLAFPTPDYVISPGINFWFDVIF